VSHLGAPGELMVTDDYARRRRCWRRQSRGADMPQGLLMSLVLHRARASRRPGTLDRWLKNDPKNVQGYRMANVC